MSGLRKSDGEFFLNLVKSFVQNDNKFVTQSANLRSASEESISN